MFDLELISFYFFGGFNVVQGLLDIDDFIFSIFLLDLHFGCLLLNDFFVTQHLLQTLLFLLQLLRLQLGFEPLVFQLFLLLLLPLVFIENLVRQLLNALPDHCLFL